MIKKYRSVLLTSMATAVFCGLWSYLASAVGFIGWAGFAGCTTYFASGERGIPGLRKTVCTNGMGVLCGMAIILLTEIIPQLGEYGVWCAVITFAMCILSEFRLLNYCPGIFMGCFGTFAANGDWKMLVPSLLLGAVLGFVCDNSGAWLCSQFDAHLENQ